MLASLRLALVAIVIAASGCVSTAYTQVDPLQFRPSAPSRITFDVLVRRASALGYVVQQVDPMRGTFLVHSRELGRPPRRRRPLRGRVRSNLFVVQVADAEVRITAFGRHVRPDGTMHPILARELAVFGAAMQRAAAIPGGVSGAVPAAPGAYGAQPPGAYGHTPASVEPPRTYDAAPPDPPSPAPPSSALGAP